MSNFIRNNQIAIDDFVALADDQPLPAAGSVIVSLARWQELRSAGAGVGAVVGVSIPNTTDITQVWASIADRPLIELQFPAFGDGRAYSQARLLRDRYGYAGELRARGAAVVADQAAQLARCGFTAFALRDDQKPDAFVARLQKAQSMQWYQRPSARPLPSGLRT